ncbi:aurora kinase A- and ninein-interacting protein [Anomalospiza imberbis]|uniref:aurora kinase A- and ninein-interacting protein n=1 Tax=Anomalospiza imberbis TaxID=187417 RepID=UPI00358FD388
MRRRRGGGAAPAEACGVWLDTAELKRGPARVRPGGRASPGNPRNPRVGWGGSLRWAPEHRPGRGRLRERGPPLSTRLRAPTRAPERRQSPVLLPQPGSRQTTIPTFFSPHADERDKENSRPTRCSPAEACEGSGVPLPAWPVKILALPQLEGAREEPPGAEQGLQGTAQAWKTPLDALELQVQSQRQSTASRGAGGDSCCCSCSQGPEKCWLFPGEAASGGREPQPWSTAPSGPGSAGAEDTNPVPGAAPRGVCCSPRSPARAQPLRERGQLPAGPCRQLFSQDSQGNRVIAHRARASPLRASPPRGLQLELGWEPLFTQDSEGNRVIKHW